MTSSIKIKNLSRLERKLRKLPNDVLKPLQQQLFLSAQAVRKTAVDHIQKGSRTGKLYTRGGKSGQRSAAGEFPKTDRGGLVSSIFVKSIKGLGNLGYAVGTKLKYGIGLELGTTKMEPRPWLFPSFKENVKDIKRDIRRSLLKVLKRAKR
jgi:hypothetical protein